RLCRAGRGARRWKPGPCPGAKAARPGVVTFRHPGKVSPAMDGVSLTLYAEIARTVGLVCQHADYQLFGETIAEELAFAPANLGTPRDVIEQRVERAREGLGIEHLGLTASPLALSVGEKQRVSIASVLTMDTQVLALDEPTLGLDPAAKQRLAGLIDALCAHGKAVVIATHDAGFSAAVADRIVRLERGRIVDDRRVQA
ncbi:MAG TPA: ABC transporter ATP-binding protein, partial [Methanoculleus sp.]|nr:ABC transporter ATP-binding protein [Methanoculleus sp.]